MLRRLFKNQLNSQHTYIPVYIWVVGLVLIAIVFLFSNNMYSESKGLEEYTGYVETDNEDGTREFLFNVSDIEQLNRGMDLLFFTSHQQVDIWADGQLIYACEPGEGGLRQTTGTVCNAINIPHNSKEVKVIIVPLYPEVSQQQFRFYIGRLGAMYRYIIRHSTFSALVSILAIVLGVACILYWLVVRRHFNIGYLLLNLGIFSISFGGWSFHETNLSVILVSNRASASAISYIAMMSAGIPLILFFKEFIDIQDRIIWKLLAVFDVVLYTVVCALHILDIRGFRQSLIFIQLTVVTSALYCLGCILSKLIKRDFSRRVVMLSILGLFALLVIIFELYRYYSAEGNQDPVGCFAIVGFIATFVIDLATGVNSVMAKEQKNKEMETFAFSDSMTGLMNRNAFEHIMNNMSNPEDVTYIICDLNNLKTVNDTMGHNCGDDYIVSAAIILEEFLGDFGNIYRIGGDEFCCITGKKPHAILEKRLRAIKNRCDNVNNSRKYPFKIQIAVGYATYDKRIDRDFENTRKRADDAMYINKKKLKKMAG